MVIDGRNCQQARKAKYVSGPSAVGRDGIFIAPMSGPDSIISDHLPSCRPCVPFCRPSRGQPRRRTASGSFRPPPGSDVRVSLARFPAPNPGPLIGNIPKAGRFSGVARINDGLDVVGRIAQDLPLIDGQQPTLAALGSELAPFGQPASQMGSAWSRDLVRQYGTVGSHAG